MDEVPVTFDMSGKYTVDKKGAQDITITTTGGEKTNFTVVLGVTADGNFCPPMVIFKRKTIPKDTPVSAACLYKEGCQRTLCRGKTPAPSNKGQALHTDLMIMVAPYLLLFLISSQIQSQKLTTEENELNHKNCGVHFLGQPLQKNRLVKKSYGGREFEENEYPWTVVLRHEEAACSGVQISRRNILTAAHCVLHFDDEKSYELCAINQSQSIVSALADPEEMSALIGGGKMRCHDIPCQHNKTLYRAKKITSKELILCNFNDDLALIELSRNISESDSTPICMPEDDYQLNPVLYASGIGFDPSSPITFDNPMGDHAHGQQVVALRYHAVDQLLHQIETVTFAKTLCPGDSGGPLFQMDEEGRHILVGINSNISRSCTRHSGNFANRFTDVRANLDWICKYSGVCPVEEESRWTEGARPLYASL
ncbi:unnamed protein product [Cylicocyclus nassatus]|uniref:Peptidase S1 domain-containing protein n=1 Tax=Cylicocyclus nassatus TaxID=53992 RepID=A0AA36MHK5_CYLNA|nr:unnamed protein product [Cylicocyclus nassatus]